MYIDRYKVYVHIYIYLYTHVFFIFLSPCHLQAKESLKHLPFFCFPEVFWTIEYMATKSMQVKTVLVSGFTGHVAGFSRFMYKKPINSSPLAQAIFIRTNPPLLKKGGRFGTSGKPVGNDYQKKKCQPRPDRTKKHRWTLKASINAGFLAGFSEPTTVSGHGPPATSSRKKSSPEIHKVFSKVVSGLKEKLKDNI